MKTRITFLTFVLSAFLFVGFAQDGANLAPVKYNLLKSNYRTNPDAALENLEWLLDNSPTLSLNIYKLGGTALNAKLKKATDAEKVTLTALGNKLFKQRFELFGNNPKEDPARAHNDYATFLQVTKGDGNKIFSELEQAYNIDPTKLSVKNIAVFFKYLTAKNKDTNPQFVFDTYDNTMEAIGKKLNGYLAKIEDYKKMDPATLSSKDKQKIHTYEVNSGALGQVEKILDKILESISNCDRLIPLYSSKFEEFKNDPIWLKRSVNRLFKKECTEDPLYAQLVEAYQNAAPSPEASAFYAGILLEKGEDTKALEFFQKAVDQETDPSKKAGYLFKVAKIMKKKGRLAQAKKYALLAAKEKPNFGRAYTFVASMYASSANKCGKGEFAIRMVYVAAEKMAKKAAAVDASEKSYALKLARNYKANQPSKKLIFNNEDGLKSGDSYRIGCWIGETVRVP